MCVCMHVAENESVHICVHVTENEIMAIGRKQVHMDIYDNCGRGGWRGAVDGNHHSNHVDAGPLKRIGQKNVSMSHV